MPCLALISAYYHELDGKEPMDALIPGKKEAETVISLEATPLFQQSKET